MICGNFPRETSRFKYRSSSYLTQFFADCDLDFVHDGSTRRYWVAEKLEQSLAEPQSGPTAPPDAFARVIKVLMNPAGAQNEGTDRSDALSRGLIKPKP